MSEMAVVFLGGPVDGLEIVLATDPVEFRFPQLDEPFPWRLRMPTPEEAQGPLPMSYVRYRKTRKTVRGRRIYSFVTKD